MRHFLAQWWRRNARWLPILVLPLLLSAAADRWQWEQSRPTAENILSWHRGLDRSRFNYPMLEIAHALEPDNAEVREQLARAYEAMGWPDKARRFGGAAR